jgi:hypothetical protein
MTEPRIYRASSLGYSLEALVAGHLGYEPVAAPEFLQKAFDEGSRLEPIVLEKLRANGWVIEGEQYEITLEVIPGQAVVVGHLDGIGGPAGSREHVVEIKTMAHKSFLDFKAHGWESKSALIEKYKWQQSAYVLGARLPHMMVAWDKETEEIAIINSGVPFYSISDIANKLQVAEDAIRDGVIPEGCTDFPCPYFYLHDTDAKVPPVQADDELEHYLSAWQEMDRQAKIYEKAKGEYRDQIIGLLASRAGELSASTIKSKAGVTVSTTWQEGGEVVSKRTAKWVTRIQGPRNAAK